MFRQNPLSIHRSLFTVHYLFLISFPNLFYASVLPGSNSQHSSEERQFPDREEYCQPNGEYTMNDRVQWSIAAIPSAPWAKKMFPELLCARPGGDPAIEGL